MFLCGAFSSDNAGNAKLTGNDGGMRKQAALIRNDCGRVFHERNIIGIGHSRYQDFPFLERTFFFREVQDTSGCSPNDTEVIPASGEDGGYVCLNHRLDTIGVFRRELGRFFAIKKGTPLETSFEDVFVRQYSFLYIANQLIGKECRE